MHEALLARVRAAAEALRSGSTPEDNSVELLEAVSDALTMFKGAPTWAAIDATTPTSDDDGHGHRVADRLRDPLKVELMLTVDATERRDFWRDLFTGLVGYAEADVGEGNAAAIVWAQALAFCGADAPADNWPQYAKPGETAQACIERHRAEQDSLMRLLAQARAITCTAHDVLAERQRQVDVEGWTPEHDDEHDDGSMAAAAAAYALAGHPAVGLASAEKLWEAAGWDTSWFRPKDTRRNLVRAGALILAEIDRLDRAAARQVTSS